MVFGIFGKAKTIVELALLLSIAAGGFYAYGALQSYGPLAQAKFRFSPLDVSLAVGELLVRENAVIPVEVANPTESSAVIPRASFDLFVEGEFLGSGEVSQQPLPANATTELSVAFESKRGDAARVVAASALKDRLAAKIVFTVYFPLFSLVNLSIGPVEVVQEIDSPKTQLATAAQELLNKSIEDVAGGLGNGGLVPPVPLNGGGSDSGKPSSVG